MRVGIAIWPQDNAEWLELGLSSKLGVEVETIGDVLKDPVAPYGLIIIDGDNPGPFFIGFYRALVSGFGTPNMIVLGNSDSPSMSVIEWEPSKTVFVAKPYEIESVLQLVVKKSETIEEAPATDTKEIKPVEGEPTSLGYLSMLPLADLVQMLCMSDWTGMICVRHLSQDGLGYLYISEGTLYHAETSNAKGLQACYQMLLWGRCQYSFDEEKVLDTVTIKVPWQEVML
ncbi:MAG: DUF4388 domain-containing protein, partial [Verrucomicrobiota bacterium]